MIWTHKNIETARQMFKQGKTFTQIAKVLGTTRSAVSGKLNRLGLKRSDLRKVNTLPDRKLPDMPQIEGKVHLRDAHPHQCRYMPGNDGMICGKQAVRHEMCQDHVDLCYVTIKSKQETDKAIKEHIAKNKRSAYSIF